MATELCWVRVKTDCICGGRELRGGQVLQVTAEEFRALIREKAATPCGPNGRMLVASFGPAEIISGGAQ